MSAQRGSRIVKGDRVTVDLGEGNPYTGRGGRVVSFIPRSNLVHVMVAGALIAVPLTGLVRE